ncbi:hypothetical protein PsYK624_012000 [Phanerochaete sordida]|uniref:Uncharacterized protein n=1 Tax=Phanerochaete sordida TaxID=48140 RepID=A0A9P3L8X2_9APHY|nr:hypothetical protein PsYK624_012000 [Phanerochaete sordida]
MAPVVEPPPTTSACPPSVEIQVANERAPVPPTAPSTSTSTLVGESSTPSVSVPQGGDHSPSGGLGATALSQPQASTSSWQEAPSRASSLSAECYADGSFGVLPDIQTNFEVPHSQAIPTPLDAIPNVSAQVHETQHPMPFDTTATALQQTQSSWQGGVYAQPSFLSQGDNVDASMARIIAQSGIDPEAFSQWSEENLVGSFRHIMNTGVAHEGVELPHMVPTESYEGQGSFGQQVPPQQQPNILQPPANMDGQGVPQFLGAGTTAESSDPFAWLEGTGAIFCRTATTPSGDEYCMAVNAAVLNELAWSIALDAQQSLPPAKLAVFYALPLEMQLAICNWDGSLPLALPEGDAVVAWTYSPEMPHLSTSYTSPAFQQEPAPSSISADVKTDPDAFSFNLDSQEDLDAAIRASLEEVLGGTVAGASAFVEEQDEIMSGPSPPPEEPPAYAEEPHLAAPAEEAKPAVEDLFPASQEPPRAEHSTIPSVPEAAPEVPPRAEGLSADDAPAASAEASAQPSPPQSAQSAPPVHTNGAQTDAQPRATSTIASLSLDDITLAVVELYVRLEYAHCTRPEVFISEDLCFVPESAARARKLDSEARRRLLSPLHAERLMCEAVQRVQAVH